MKTTEMQKQLSVVRDMVWDEVVKNNDNLIHGHRVIGVNGDNTVASVEWGIWFDYMDDTFKFHANGNIYKVREFSEAYARAKVMDRLAWEYSLADFVDTFGTDVSVDDIVDRKMEDREEVAEILRVETYCDEVILTDNGYTTLKLEDFGNYDLNEFSDEYCNKKGMSATMTWVLEILKEVHIDSIVGYTISLEDTLRVLSLDNEDRFLEDVKNVLDI